jgi:hypothetical protein
VDFGIRFHRGFIYFHPQGAVSMPYKRFEDLPVWNSAIDLAVQVYDLTDTVQFRRRRSLKDQIERAAVSVSNNIAEGFERGTNNELLAFLYISRGIGWGSAIDAVFARASRRVSDFDERD